MRAIVGAFLAALAVAAPLVAAPSARGQAGAEILWVRQFGTAGGDYGSAVAVDASGIYVVGRTLGAMPADDYDALLRKYDLNGGLLWNRQFGTASFDYGNAVAAGGSRVFVAGHTGGSLAGGPDPAGVDAYVRGYGISGNLLWTREFGSPNFDTALGVTIDASGLYVVGRTEGTLPGEVSAGTVDAFIRKYDFLGNVTWSHQFGTEGFDAADGVAADASGIYVTGETGGTFPGEVTAGGGDGYVRKYDGSGNVLWTHEFGTDANDGAFAIAVDLSGVYVAGLAAGTFPGQTKSGAPGSANAFLQKYDTSGQLLWTRQFGASRDAVAYGIAVGGSGVYVTGQADGTFPGSVSAGSSDGFLWEFDPSGNAIGSLQFGTSAFDRANGVAVGPAGPYVVGDTTGTFAGATNEGGVDAFLAAPRAPLPAPFEGPPAGARLLVGLVAAAAVPIASVAAICLVRWRIFRPRS